MTDRKTITIPQWLGLIYDELVKMNNKMEKMMKKDANTEQTRKKAKDNNS